MSCKHFPPTNQNYCQLHFATHDCSGKTVVDPSYLEERVGSAILSLCVNSYREVCSIYFDYIEYTSLVADVIPSVSNFAANYANELVREIKAIVKEDVEAK